MLRERARTASHHAQRSTSNSVTEQRRVPRPPRGGRRALARPDDAGACTLGELMPCALLLRHRSGAASRCTRVPHQKQPARRAAHARHRWLLKDCAHGLGGAVTAQAARRGGAAIARDRARDEARRCTQCALSAHSATRPPGTATSSAWRLQRPPPRPASRSPRGCTSRVPRSAPRDVAAMRRPRSAAQR